MIEGQDPPVAGENDCARRGQDLERVPDRGSPREIDLEHAQRFAEARRDVFDCWMLGGPARSTARGRKDD